MSEEMHNLIRAVLGIEEAPSPSPPPPPTPGPPVLTPLEQLKAALNHAKQQPIVPCQCCQDRQNALWNQGRPQLPHTGAIWLVTPDAYTQLGLSSAGYVSTNNTSYTVT